MTHDKILWEQARVPRENPGEKARGWTKLFKGRIDGF